MTFAKSIPSFCADARKILGPNDRDSTAGRGTSESMFRIGSRIDERGVIVREGERFIFRRELGGRWLLEPERVSDAHAGHPVVMRGVIVGEGLVSVEAIVASG